MGTSDRLARALEYARSLEDARESAPPRQRRQGDWRGRQRGSTDLGETVVIPAGTEIARMDASGREYYWTLTHDTVLPADCVGGGEIIIGDDDWFYGDWD